MAMDGGTARRTGLAMVAAVVGAAVVGQWLGRTAGSTHAERRRPLPGDERPHPRRAARHRLVRRGAS
jgi:hypothetical protein